MFPGLRGFLSGGGNKERLMSVISAKIGISIGGCMWAKMRLEK